MADVEDVPKRVPMTLGAGYGLVWVPEEQVAERTVQGWYKVRQSRRADTGSIPKQTGN